MTEQELREQVELSLIAMCWSLFGHQVCSGRQCDFGRSNANGLCFGLVQYRDQILDHIKENYVRLSDDQSLPITTNGKDFNNAYRDIGEAYYQKYLLKAGFMKVEL